MLKKRKVFFMNHVVVFAGGVGSRMGETSIPKQFLKIYGKPIIIHTLEKFDSCSLIDSIAIACLESWIPHLKELVSYYGLKKVKRIVPGGETGQISIYNGLCALKDFVVSEKDIVLIHDGVRPLIDHDLIRRNIEAVEHYGSAISSSPVNETIIHVEGDGMISKIYERSDVRYAKAPQSFYYKDLFSAHEKARKDRRYSFIDSSSLMMHYGASLHIVDCSNDNIKVTTPKDYYMVKALLDSSESKDVFV